MRVLVAGATGAIGRPLVDQLLQAGHDVAAITRSQERAAGLRERGVEAHVADAFDREAVVAACEAARPEVVVHQLTAIPAFFNPRKYAEAFAPTNRLRAHATPHLVEGAQRAGARKLVVQSISFITAPDGRPVHDEDAAAREDDPAGVVPAVMTMERTVLGAADLESVVLRYGFFYGPGTSYGPGGGIVEAIRKRAYPVVGKGRARSSFVHVEDAAEATVLALDRGAGVLNVCDDEPAPMHDWLPHAAQLLGARPPRRVPALVARVAVGPHAVLFGDRLPGNANARGKEALGWTPRRPSWRDGFREVLAG